MKTDWAGIVAEKLAEVPEGYVRESILSPTAPETIHHHRLFFQRGGKGELERAELFPGLTLTRMCIQSEDFPHHHAARQGGLELTHCHIGRVGWSMKEGVTLYLGPGDLALHTMDCCAHSVLGFPLGYYEGVSLTLDPEKLAAQLPPVLAQAGVDPLALRERFCPKGHPAVLTARPELEPIFQPLYDLPQALRLPYYTLKVQELFLTLSRMDPPEEKQPTQYLSQQVELIRAIHDQLMDRPDQRVTIETLAKAYHLNTSTLKTVFKAVYGQPIAAHMKHHRMQEAARLLRETDRSVGDIAQQVGYENQSKFSKVFRETFQILPTEYRRQQRG